MVCSKNDETLKIFDYKIYTLNKVETFKYLESSMNAKGGCEEDVTHRIAVAWQKWKELAGVVCDLKMPIRLKGKVYRKQ